MCITVSSITFCITVSSITLHNLIKDGDYQQTVLSEQLSEFDGSF